MKKIVEMVLFHCARGSGCKKCDALAAQGPKYTLIELIGRGGMIARPMMEIEFEGDKTWMEFDILETFENKDDAEAYSNENGIEIIIDD